MFDSDDNEPTELKINDKYAKRYDEWRNKEELQKLKDRYGDVALNSNEEGESSTDESEDDDAREWNDTMEKSFLSTLSLIKSKSEKIYNKNEVLFQQSDDTIENDKKIPKSGAQQKQKPVYLKDLERELILKKMKKDKESDDEEEENDCEDEKPREKLQSKSYYEEQDEIKESFKKINTTLDEGDDGLLKVKSKSSEENIKEQEDYLQWLKGQKVPLKDKNLEKDMKHLRDYWNDPSLSESDRFLRDYILNKRYLDKDDDDAEDEIEPLETSSIPNDKTLKVEDINELIEDEEALENQEEFERKYNFRYEEPDPEFIKTYPRTLNDSLRRKDTKRKDKREEYKQRKEAEKQKKKEEIKRLKNLKKKEIMDKIEKIKHITGNDDLALDVDVFEKDFDPKEYDRKMEEMFNSNYYADHVDEEKPVFSDDDLSDVEIYDNDDYIDQIDVDEENPEPKKKKKRRKNQLKMNT